MAAQRLTVADLRGVFAIMPTPALDGADRLDAGFTVDLNETERCVDALISDGVDGIMLNGTFGEAATLTGTEWREFTRRVIEVAAGRVPVLAGATTLNTRDTIERAEFAAQAGAAGLLLGRPMWNRLAPDQVIGFYTDIATAVPELGVVIYNNPAAFKSAIDPAMWAELADIPQMVGAKYGALNVAYRDAMAGIGGKLLLMPIEYSWHAAARWFPGEISACWSSSALCGPAPALRLRDAMLAGDLETAGKLTERIASTYQTFFPPQGDAEFRIYNIQLEKARMNAAGYVKAGPSRRPYHELPADYEAGARLAGERWAALARELAVAA